MENEPKIELKRLKADIIAATGEGKSLSRRGLSLQATNGKNADLVRDLISRDRGQQLTLETVVGLANAMGKDVAYYISKSAVAAAGRIPMMVRGRVEAGVWMEYPEWPEQDRYTIEVDPPTIEGAVQFGLELHGYSMEKIIPPGSVLECLDVYSGGGIEPQNGDIVIVRRRLHDLVEMTCKRLEIRPDGTRVLHCESDRPEFAEPIFIGRPDLDLHTDHDIEIIALVDRSVRQFVNRSRQRG